MNPSIALLAFMIGIGGLFYLDRDSSLRTSKALWLPVVWLAINGSRSVSSWLGIGGSAGFEGLPGSNPVDQLVAGILMALGVVVILNRGRDAIVLVRRSWPLVFYFSFCLVSLVWSDFPGWGFKRWIRSLGDLIMVIVVLTDAQPIAALRRLFSRVGFVLLPASILLIKYFPNLGRGYEVTGQPMNTGVTTNKNELGVIALVLALGALWQLLRLLGNKNRPDRIRHLLAECALLYFGISVLFAAHSATSGACFALGASLMLVTARPVIRRHPTTLHALVFGMLLCGGLIVLLGGQSAVTSAMGRSGDLTGRTDVWKVVIPMVPNPLFGAGFETFWLGLRVENVRAAFSSSFIQSVINEAHNGYIETYLNLGLFGVGIIALIFAHGYTGAVNAFRRKPALGALLLAYILASAFYNITEAGFRMLNPMWFFLLLSVMASKAVIGVDGAAPNRDQARSTIAKENKSKRLCKA